MAVLVVLMLRFINNPEVSLLLLHETVKTQITSKLSFFITLIKTTGARENLQVDIRCESDDIRE